MSGAPEAEIPGRATTATGPRVLLATRNAGKIAELRRMLAGDAVVLGLDDVVAFEDQAETGATFEENALAKARHASAVTGEVVLADDSGLTVGALNGMPGVLSARWSGRHGDDSANTALLLGQLADVPDERRTAAFVCAVAIVVPGPHGLERVVSASWPGRVIRDERGANGFGYDPIFVPHESDADGSGRTSAELAPQEKDALSHRSRA
ncbi:MAG TPA: RdgB/HAM1 family non-canonical purine NTP pyrophosphatase, partial [Nakamurella sp.]